MSTVVVPGEMLPAGRRKTPYLAIKLLGFTALLGVAIFFVRYYVFYYYLHYSEAGFTDPAHGSSNYWAMRGWLLLHISSGMTALLVGPWQFWTGFRRRYARTHRWMGRIFLCSVLGGAIAAFRLNLATTSGWAVGSGIFCLAVAWITTAGMAYYAIRKGLVAIHKEWMIRTYVVTLAFVTFRAITDWAPTSQLKPTESVAIVAAWSCWAVPLLVTELILQLRRIRAAAL
jgi:uncharacterized membrane protein